MSALFNGQSGKDWIYIILRLLMITSFSVLLFLINPRNINDFNSIQDISIPAIVGIVGAVLVAAMTLIKATRIYAPFAVLVSDWALAGAYVYYAIHSNPLLLIGILGAIIVSGVLRVGILIGAGHAIGVLVAAIAALGFLPEIGFNRLMRDYEPYIPIIVILALLAILSAVWSNTLDEENSKNRKSLRKEIEESRTRLENMRERSRSIADMATSLNASLNFERILDAALDIGRLSVRNDNKQRLISIALMVSDEDGTLEIADARGLQQFDMHERFKGERGIIAEAMEKGEPIIIDGGSDDPELNVLNAFAGIKTTLCIPLRANYETYGVLVFGSSAQNAINEDHIDTLAAIGVQATIALQNAMLYTNLREEKERILRIEENGRKALVRDLHDIPTQTVSAVAMHLSTIPMILKRQPDKVVEEVENIRQMALRATEEIRHVMFTLRPLSLEASGLTTALDQLAEKMEKTYKQPMKIQVDKKVEEVLDKEKQGTLFYLIEEAANNARKYAEASQIQVRGAVQGNEVVIQIRDNGKGFDMSVLNNYAGRGSFGMVNMRERAELINGSFDMQSAVGKGTTVTVRVIIQDANRSSSVAMVKPRKALRKQYTGPLSPSQ
jgi:signal transduction histidine kinase